ncbi:MAG: mannitol-1-phosphate 5-dehydrogenase, partial [Sphaerochaetaceae bacterium]|nr:mannitol-1-phosphate 5-dehydrogenase [Sphaerochaetaceae bacterium]
MKSLFVQWGAGNIGRSFIGQVFARKGYQVIFIDIDKKLIEALNQHGQYMVEAVSREGIRQLPITGISACDAGDQQAVNDAITQATLMGVSVGKNVWPFIAKQLA